MRAKQFELVEKLKAWGNWIVRSTQSLPPIPQSAIRQAFGSVATEYANVPDVVKVCWGICAFSSVVFIAWHVPRLAGFMTANFVHHPLSGRTRTTLTSVFSHYSFFHFLFNSMALLSFGPLVGQYLYSSQKTVDGSKRLESTTGYHFLAMFVAAGLVASLASHILRVKFYDRMVANFSKLPKGTKLYVGGSLGASGAIYACITIDAMAYPDLKISPIFVPYGVPIRWGVGALVLLDLVGILRGWRMFDHVAHFGGAVFGVWYALYGPALWARWRALGAYMFDTKPKETERSNEWN
ncbi:hypothetical protein K438DRAFT_1797249 [Mycena galopus ATCC 62051]|nr:hypothetical protein K438DRAFT_1797249 [Mycena galopus ATCC 62051]